MTTPFIDRLISAAMGESPLIIPYLGPDNLPESLNLSDTFFVSNDQSIEKVPGSHPSLDEKTDNVRHIEKNYAENNTSGEIYEDHNSPIDEWSQPILPPRQSTPAKPVSILPPSQHNISTDHDTELKEDSSYTKPPLNKSTPAKPKSDILPEFDLGDDSNKEPRIRRPIIFDILNNSRDVDDQDKNQDLKGNLDITAFTDPPSKLTRQNQPRAIPKENRLNIIESSEPTVTINIGRIDVRAITSSPSEYIQRMPSLSLADYLKRRSSERQ